MAAGSRDHSPVSVELGRRCGQNGTNDWNSQRQREGAHTIANHESPLMFRFIREAPATGGTPGLRVPLGGTCDGEGNPSPAYALHPSVYLVKRFRPALHVNYAETVLPVRDGLPKFKDFPAEHGGSGEQMPE